MNLNLVDLSNHVKTEFKGRFNDIVSRTINDIGATNIRGEMLDLGKNNKNMVNKEILERLRYLQENNMEIDFLGDLARKNDIAVDKIQNILSALANVPIEFSKKRGNVMRESLQIGDKIEINTSGDGLTHNYAGMLNSYGIVKALKTRISDLQKLIKEKDEVIAVQRETIELLKNK